VVDNNSVKLDASSYRNKASSPDHGKLSSFGSWTAERENFDQYLQVDLGGPFAVYGVDVAGDKIGHYVTSYQLLYSLDGVSYRYILTKDGIVEVFRGPADSLHSVRQVLSMPVEAR